MHRGDTGDITSDPKTVNARIFVGSINPAIKRDDLEQYFSKYGKVVGKYVYFLWLFIII